MDMALLPLDTVQRFDSACAGIVRQIYKLNVPCGHADSVHRYVLVNFLINLEGDAKSRTQSRTLPTFTVLLALASVYQLILLYDTLAKENTIQVFSLCVYDVVICIYSVLQIVETKQAMISLVSLEDFDLSFWNGTRQALLALAFTTGFSIICTCLISWKLYNEFAWSLFKFVHADFTLRRRYLIFEVRSSISSFCWHRLYLIVVKCYITVLKFNFFLSVGFLIQLILLVERRDIEWIVMLCAIPVSILSLMAGSFVTRRENYYGSIIVMASYDHQSSRSLLMHLGVQSCPTRVLYFQGISHVYS